jgi:hypothetical protein
MRDEILLHISTLDPRAHSRAVKQNAEWVIWLDRTFPGYPIATQIALLRRGDLRNPSCANCGGSLHNIYKKTCSIQCREELKTRTGERTRINAQRKNTTEKKYGVTNVAKIQEIQQKRLNTLKEKYGTLSSPKTIESARERAKQLSIKGRETLQRQHGVSNPAQLPDHHTKCRKTMMSAHGVDHWSRMPVHRERLKEQKENNWNSYLPLQVELMNITDGFVGKPNDRLRFTCHDCGSSETLPSETAKWRVRTCGTPCAACADIKKGSRKEADLANWIQDQNIEIIRHDRVILDGLELDIVIPDKKLAIEFCGLYWHNDQRIAKNYHRDKMMAARAAGYQLITLFEDEWDHRQSQVKHRLRGLLNLTDQRVSARRTQVMEISTTRAREFMDQYHISGYSRSTHKLGLEFEGELVAVMTFARPNRSKGARKQVNGYWEIARFATKCNVAGAASRLFSHFVKKYSPEHVFSYADLRWGQGGVYQYLDMTRETDTVPGYWYVSGDKRIHRFALRKKSHEPKNITERELREQDGYLRIWDCGHSKWEWKRKKSGN